MAKIYLSGPITGNPNYVDSFAIAEKQLELEGHTVFNPAVLPEGLTQKDYMRISIAMIEAADTVIMLPGWEGSKGAQIERAYAEKIGLRVAEWEELYEQMQISE